MSAKWLRGAAWIALIATAGCDPNPNGPSAPAASPDDSGNGSDSTDDPAKHVPLKRVGAPIGMVVPTPA